MHCMFWTILFSKEYDMDGTSLYPLMKNELQRIRENFLIEYTGEGGVGNQKECSTEVPDMDNFAICEPEWDCKCQDSRNNTYTCLRTKKNAENTLFCVFEDDEAFVEFYDLDQDLHQLHNMHESGIDNKYHDLVQKLKKCEGFDKCNSH